jgi:ATP synthase subunit 6
MNRVNIRASPLEQFEVFSLIPLRRGSLDLSITNSTFRRILTVAVLVLFGLLTTVQGGGLLVPSRWQAIGEGIYGLVVSRVGPRGAKGQGYFPVIFALFSFLLTANLLGRVPYSFTVTSHLIVTLTLARAVWVGKLRVGIRLHGIRLLGRFLPAGAPIARAPRLVPLEIRGFFITLLSLSVRLFANRRAGHILLKVIGGFAWSRRLAGGILWVGHFVPLIVLYLLLFLETGVARVQAYVFSLLASRYLNDRLDGGH